MDCVELLRIQKNAILEIARRNRAGHVRVFGSVARGTATETSDVDILTDMQPGATLFDLVGFKQDLEELLGRPVHVVTTASLSPYFRDQVLHEAVPL